MDTLFRVPSYTSIVHNDECLFTYQTPFCPGGLFVNLKTWLGLAPEFLSEDLAVHEGRAAYVHLEYTNEPVEQAAVSKLAINMDGGFQSGFKTVRKLSVLVEHANFSLDDPRLPPGLAACALAVAEHQGPREQAAVASWEDEERPVSKFAAALVQEEPRFVSMDPKNWKCELTGSVENLWLNLSDGFIGSGRRNFDGTGGTNGAMDHYMSQKLLGKNYPLVVKLGTISADSPADVYSYDPSEDGMVIDPHLTSHLAHWGIDRSRMKKSEKTMAELEVELNKDFAFDKIVETGDVLEPVSDLPGLKNQGNTCYLNSVCQLLCHCVGEMKGNFGDSNFEIRKKLAKSLLKNSNSTDLVFELTKLVTALTSSRSGPIVPFAFRKSVAQNHVEFQSSRQQDAVEFLLHFFKQLERTNKNIISSLFAFEVQDKLVCEGLTKISNRKETILAIQPVEAGNEAKKICRADDGIACVSNAFAPSVLEGFRSPLTGQVATDAVKSFAPTTMPPYLLISVNRYLFTPSFEPAKLDVAVHMAEVLDMEPFRAAKEVSNWPTEEAPICGALGQELLSMGFSESLVREALSKGEENALGWILENSVDNVADTVNVLVGMGFTSSQAREALAATDNRLERAADWLFSREPVTKESFLDGPGTYDLLGMVSHIGKSTSTGHYVCHAKIDGNWVIFNDELVAKSKKPPLDYGYLYLYKRRLYPQ